MTDYSELKLAAEAACIGDKPASTPIGDLMVASDLFHAAANPKAILMLIAEIERVEMHFSVTAEVLEKTVAQRDQLKTENEALREVMSCVVNEVPRNTHRDGNAPGHCHEVPGIWDRGNGGKAGTVCGWCKVWNAAVAMSKEPQS